jgi:hypothetical protein
MKRRAFFSLIGALSAVLVAAAVSVAAVPQTISYQGYLTDSGGTPVNGTVQMQFKLYSSQSTTAVPLWSETHQSVQVTQGSYGIVLGNGSPTPVPINLPFDMPYYLGVTVGSDAEMTPRLPLTSTAYAFRAAQADGLSGSATLTATNTIVSTVPTGVAPLQIASTTLVPNLNAEMVGGMHATDFVAKAGDTMTGNLTVPSATLTGILTLPTTTVGAGIIMQGGNRLIHSYGNANFFAGRNAGNLTIGYGSANTAVGVEALNSLNSGDWNTATGFRALYSNDSGYFNTASGFYALTSNTTGYWNTASGIRSLMGNITGYNNTAYGANSLQNNTTGAYNTAAGVMALGSNNTGHSNTAFGIAALIANTIASGNTAMGHYSLSSNTTGSFNTAVGNDADVSSDGLTNATAIGNGAIVTASNYVRIGNIAVTHIGGQVGFSNDSDVREKKDIQDVGYGLGFIKQLRPVQFRMKNGNDRIDFGFIAQDIETLIGTNYNVLGIGGTEERMLSLRYTDFIAPMVKAMQEQQVQIDEQKSMIEELKADIAALKQRLP